MRTQQQADNLVDFTEALSKLPEEEQAARIQAIPAPTFREQFGMAKDTFTAGLTPATRAQEPEAMESDVMTGEQRAAAGVGMKPARVVRPGMTQAERGGEADIAASEAGTARTRAATAREAREEQVARFTRVRELTNPFSPAKQEVIDPTSGRVRPVTLAEAHTLLDYTDMPAVEEIMARSTNRSALEQEIDMLAQGAFDGDVDEAREHVLYMQIKHPRLKNELDLLEGEERIRASKALRNMRTEGPPPGALSDSAISKIKQERIQVKSDFFATITNAGNLDTIKLDENGQPKLRFTFFGGLKGAPYTTVRQDIDTTRHEFPIDYERLNLLIDPLDPTTVGIATQLGIQAPFSPEDSASKAHIEKTLTAIEKDLGIQIMSIELPPVGKDAQPKLITRPEFIARIAIARQKLSAFDTDLQRPFGKAGRTGEFSMMPAGFDEEGNPVEGKPGAAATPADPDVTEFESRVGALGLDAAGDAALQRRVDEIDRRIQELSQPQESLQE